MMTEAEHSHINAGQDGAGTLLCLTGHALHLFTGE